MRASSFGNWGLRLALALVVGGIFASASGCGDDDDTAIVDMAATLDMTAGPDFASSPFAGVQCADMGCNAPSICCIRPTGNVISSTCEGTATCTGAMAGTAACDGPEDCSNASPLCCAAVAFKDNGDGTGVPLAGSSSCTATCPADVQRDETTKKISLVSKLCHQNSDCANFSGTLLGSEFAFDGCCYRTEIDFRFCAPKGKDFQNLGDYFCLD